MQLHVERMLRERERQYNLPGIELDIRNTPNDWVAIISRYAAGEVRRGGVKPTREDFEDSLIKAGAIILAALEHCDKMDNNNYFEKNTNNNG